MAKLLQTGKGGDGVSSKQSFVVGSNARHTGFYTIEKRIGDIDIFRRDPLYTKIAESLSLREIGTFMGPILQHVNKEDIIPTIARSLAERDFHRRIEPYQTIVTEPNLMMTQGVKYLFTTALGSGTTTASSTAAATQGQYGYLTAITGALGVGDNQGGTTIAATNADTDLNQNAANFWYQADGSVGNPHVGITGANNTLSIQVAVASASANFAWNEIIAGNFANNTAWSSSGWASGTARLAAALGTAATANWAPASASAYSLLSHKSGAGFTMGTKVSGSTWTVTYTLQIT